MTASDFGGLRQEWDALLERRKALRSSLEFWTPILDGWAGWSPGALAALAWSPAECEKRWIRGVPLLAEAPPELSRDGLEALLGPLIERLAGLGAEEADALERFAGEWDAGRVGPADLFPTAPGGPAALQERLRVPGHLLAFLAHASLRPPLDAYFAGVRALPEGAWAPGACPWCGGVAAFGDIVEDGRRRLSCHLCGGAWLAPRLRCPFCQSWQSEDLVRLLGEEGEEGYFIEACRACHGYLKGVDRRQRWNAGSALVEDWGSPHLDVHAAREGYWRATPTLAQLVP